MAAFSIQVEDSPGCDEAHDNQQDVPAITMSTAQAVRLPSHHVSLKVRARGALLSVDYCRRNRSAADGQRRI